MTVFSFINMHFLTLNKYQSPSSAVNLTKITSNNTNPIDIMSNSSQDLRNQQLKLKNPRLAISNNALFYSCVVLWLCVVVIVCCCCGGGGMSNCWCYLWWWRVEYLLVLLVVVVEVVGGVGALLGISWDSRDGSTYLTKSRCVDDPSWDFVRRALIA